MSKYYTPRIEEFTINFNYEYNTWKGWSLKVMDSFNHRPNGTMNLQYDLVLNRSKFRVKYLDRDDIESLGFSVDSYFEAIQSYKRYNTDDFSCIQITCFNSDNIVEIRNPSRIMFQGIIKNKSELERILKIIDV